jgi:hypothetical protein
LWILLECSGMFSNALGSFEYVQNCLEGFLGLVYMYQPVQREL